MMKNVTFLAQDETATANLGKVLGQLLPDGTVVALYGTLGSGKTRLVQAVANDLGCDRHQVTSPTFVLIQHYEGKRRIHHVDVYRVRDGREFLELGVEELYEDRGLIFIEWADRVEPFLPSRRVEIHIEIAGPTARQFTLCTLDPGLEDILLEIGTTLKGSDRFARENQDTTRGGTR